MFDWDKFSKYVGIQGIMGLLMLIVYLLMTLWGKPVPELFTNLMTMIIGYYFAKNGLNVMAAWRGQALARRKDDK